jgi:monoterpene epsilon-lactone hydrolase
MSSPKNASLDAPWATTHPLTSEDAVVMIGLREMVFPMKGKMQGVAARVPFDAIMGRVQAPSDVTVEADNIGGVAGWWCRPVNARVGEVILHLHGGWYNWGSAHAFRGLAAHIAVSAGAAVFIPDYRLAPESPFPAAASDVQACYEGLFQRGASRVAIVGDSAGGGLALGLLAWATSKAHEGSSLPVAAVVLSPVTDLTLSGESWSSRADADPYFTRAQVEALVKSYLNEQAATDPLASPLYGIPPDLPPVRVHVGNDEVLLDDSCCYVERAVAAGVDAKLDVWEGMPHGFLSTVGRTNAATSALEAIGNFLALRLSTKPGNKCDTADIKEHA